MHIDLKKLFENIKANKTSVEIKRQRIILGALLANKTGIFEEKVNYPVEIPSLTHEGEVHKFDVTLSSTITGCKSNVNSSVARYEVDGEEIGSGTFGDIIQSLVTIAIKYNARIRFILSTMRIIKEQEIIPEAANGRRNPYAWHKVESDNLSKTPHSHAKEIVVNDSGTKTRIVSNHFTGDNFFNVIEMDLDKWKEMEIFFKCLFLNRAYKKQIFDVKFVHNDIKPENIIYDEESDTFNFIDYAFATRNGDFVTRFAGSPNYAAFEVFCGRGSAITDKSDIVGLGIIFSYLCGEDERGDERKDHYSVMRDKAEKPDFPNLFRNMPNLSPNLKSKMRNLIYGMNTPEIHKRYNWAVVELTLQDIIATFLVESRILTAKELYADIAIIKPMLDKLSQSSIVPISFHDIKRFEAVFDPLKNLTGDNVGLGLLVKSLLDCDVLNQAHGLDDMIDIIKNTCDDFKKNLTILQTQLETVTQLRDALIGLPVQGVTVQKQVRDLNLLGVALRRAIDKSLATPMTLDALNKRALRMAVHHVGKFKMSLDKIQNDRYMRFAFLKHQLVDKTDSVSKFKNDIVKIIEPQFQERMRTDYFLEDAVVEKNLAFKALLSNIVSALEVAKTQDELHLMIDECFSRKALPDNLVTQELRKHCHQKVKNDNVAEGRGRCSIL